MNPSRGFQTWLPLCVFACLFVFFVHQFVLGFWLSDDAYISFRTADNFVNGLGLRWNIAERVQSYTNPLWLFLISLLYKFTGDLYWSAFTLSLVCSGGAVLAGYLIIVRRGEKAWAAVLFVLLLCSSRAFMDYTGSGLENPFLFLAAAILHGYLLFGIHFQGKFPYGLLLGFCIAALAFVNRQDSVLLFLPPLTVAAWRSWKLSRRGTVQAVLLGGLPVIMWLTFSLIYYGFPFPNTYYAKLNSHLSYGTRWKFGLQLLEYSLKHDPITVIVIFLGIIAAFRRKEAVIRSMGAAICIFLLYTGHVGGDFMGGRFYALPYLIAALILAAHFSSNDTRTGTAPAHEAFERLRTFALPICISLVSSYLFFSPTSIVSSAFDYKAVSTSKDSVIDEKGFYYKATNIKAYFGSKSCSKQDPSIFPDHGWSRSGRKAAFSEQPVRTLHAAGFFGFHAGPRKYLIDFYGLTDPLLARIPGMGHRNGHLARLLPAGYTDSVVSGNDAIKDPSLRTYYRELLHITRGPLFTRRRWKNIIAFNLGSRRRFNAPYQLAAVCLNPIREIARRNPTVRAIVGNKNDIELSITILEIHKTAGGSCKQNMF